VTPSHGEALITMFKMTCDNWLDSDNTKQPLLYWFITGSGSERTVINRGIQNNLERLLPLGDPSTNYSLPVEVWVQDSLGAYTVALKKYVCTFLPFTTRLPSYLIARAEAGTHVNNDHVKIPIFLDFVNNFPRFIPDFK